MAVLQSNYQEKLEKILSTGKKRSYFIAAITVFFILLMSLAGIIPAVSSLGLQHEENGKRDLIIEKLTSKLTTLKSFVREENDKKGVIDFLDYLLPEKFPERDALTKLVDIETKNNVLIKTYTFATPEAGTKEIVDAYSSLKVEVLNVSFTGTGTLSNIQAFIKDIEESRRVFDVKSVEVSKITGSVGVEEGRDYTMGISIIFYYYNTNVATPVL